jgi:hypothetical protein
MKFIAYSKCFGISITILKYYCNSYLGIVIESLEFDGDKDIS